MKTEPNNTTQATDYDNLVDLLAVLTEANNQMAVLQAEANDAMLQIVDEHKKDYAKLQQIKADTEAALEIIARKHPEWFAKKKSLTTPFGAVSLKTNPPKLEVKNEELSIVLLEQEAERNPEFKVAGFIEVKKVLRLDVLAGEEDAFLKKFRIHRTQEDTFSAKPATLKLGEAVKEEEPGTK